LSVTSRQPKSGKPGKTALEQAQTTQRRQRASQHRGRRGLGQRSLGGQIAGGASRPSHGHGSPSSSRVTKPQAFFQDRRLLPEHWHLPLPASSQAKNILPMCSVRSVAYGPGFAAGALAPQSRGVQIGRGPVRRRVAAAKGRLRQWGRAAARSRQNPEFEASKRGTGDRDQGKWLTFISARNEIAQGQ
jgi:hypothetical protein